MFVVVVVFFSELQHTHGYFRAASHRHRADTGLLAAVRLVARRRPCSSLGRVRSLCPSEGVLEKSRFGNVVQGAWRGLESINLER